MLPERGDLVLRLPAVLEAVYGAYAIDWQSTPGGAPIDTLSAEAMHLAMVLTELLPEGPKSPAWRHRFARRKPAPPPGRPAGLSLNHIRPLRRTQGW